MPLTYKAGNVFEDIKEHEDFKFHTILCDPPYNLSTQWEVKDGLRVKGKSKDFMNKWEGLDETHLDTFFKESYRILKYGGYCVMFSIDRQAFAFQYFAVKNGFEVCQSLAWYFISSFPKSTDVAKSLTAKEIKGIASPKGLRQARQGDDYKPTGQKDYRKGRAFGKVENDDKETELTPKAKQFDGYKYGIAPFKQATETILVFRKPPKESILDDILSEDEECSPSVVNIEGGRVGTEKMGQESGFIRRGRTDEEVFMGNDKSRPKGVYKETTGRYPSTVFVDENIAANIDEQSGVSKSSGGSGKASQRTAPNGIYGKYKEGYIAQNIGGLGDTGGASKILHKCKYDEEEYNLLNYEPKVSKKERNAGLEGFEEKVGGNHNDSGRSYKTKCKKCEKEIRKDDRKNRCVCEQPDEYYPEVKQNNNHATLKPISLIHRVATLFKLPVEQKLYIPFAGVASEIIGCMQAGFDDIHAVELTEEYVTIGKARIKHWTAQKTLF